MPLKISAFPKCYIDDIAVRRTMTIFEWIELAQSLDADGLEMYEGFLTELDAAYLDSVGESIHAAGFAMPMLCCSSDFTNPSPSGRKVAIKKGNYHDSCRAPPRWPRNCLPRAKRSALPRAEPRTGAPVGDRSN